MNERRTRKSVPDALSAAQSNGPYPGASATFSRIFFTGGFVVLGGRPKVDEDDVGTERDEEDMDLDEEQWTM